MNKNATALRNLVALHCQGSTLLKGMDRAWPSSRWQSLTSQGYWLKREDELSFSISGPKFRKLCCLAGQGSVDTIVSWGSSRSAFLFGLAQLCKSEGIDLKLMLLRSTPYQDFGSDRLYENTFRGFSCTWLNREEWPEVARLAAKALEGLGNSNTLLLPEGGATKELLPGALSLALDIYDQAKTLAPDLAEIWIDSGSGFTAQALILGLGILFEGQRPPLIHVVLCAGREEEFQENLQRFAGELELLLEGHREWQPAPFRCHRPIAAPSYGSTNQKVWKKIAEYQQIHGILLDPIYTAKLILTFESLIKAEGDALNWNQRLLIHSGGGFNNFGFRNGPALHEV